MRNLLALIFFLFFFITGNSLCWATQSHFASWNAIVLQGRVEEKWGWYLELQNRVGEGWDQINGNSPETLKLRNNRLLVRPAIRYFPRGDGSLQLHFGYAWTPNLSPDRNEHRIYQQVTLQEDQDRWAWAHRFRLEERWIEKAGKTSLRARHFARTLHYLSEERTFALTLWDEVFWNLNTVSLGPKAGLDQNRLFLGPQWILQQKTRFELGYLNVFLAKGAAIDSMMSHVLAAYVFIDF